MSYQKETKNCQNCKKDFTIDPEDFLFYEKIKVPPPTFCPECRRQRRFAWRNYINFYHRKDINGKDVISLYSPESNISVLNSKDWNNYNIDFRDYGVDYDFSKSFFLQYAELLKKTPRLAMDNDDGVFSKNCQYTNDFLMGKDCYLVIKAWKLENVMYSFYVVNSKNLVDVCTSFGKDEGNYETVNFEIINTLGQIVYKGYLVDKTIVQTTTFAPGVYIIKLDNGKTLEFKKIIKE